MAAEIVLSYYKYWDGKGDPYGTIRAAIPIAAHGTTIVDAHMAS